MSKTYRFDVGTGAYVAWVAAPSTIAILAGAATLRHQMDSETAVLLGIFFCWYCFFGWLFLLQNAPLLVSSSGLERQIFGVSIRKLNWNFIRSIREFALYSRASGGRIIWIKVVPMNCNLWHRAIGCNITIPSRTKEFSDLIQMLNAYAVQYQIAIYKKDNSEWVALPKLIDRVEDLA
jgi:hypothetical protein